MKEVSDVLFSMALRLQNDINGRVKQSFRGPNGYQGRQTHALVRWQPIHGYGVTSTQVSEARPGGSRIFV
jgi:hypothetical protein